MEKNDFYRMIDEAEGTTIAVPALIRKVYTWMAMALTITGITAYGVATSPNLIEMILTNKLLFWGLIIAELGMVMALSARLHKLSLTSATLLFILYSVLNGATLSVIFLAYTMTSIATTFFVTAGTFGVMSIYGYTTKTNLDSIGKFLTMALIGLIIAIVINLFLGNSMFEIIISGIGVLVFVGLTAWDTQKIKRMIASVDFMDDSAQKLALIGALSLYLDFINLFLFLLRFLGGNRN